MVHRAAPPRATSESQGRLGAPRVVRDMARAYIAQGISASCTSGRAMSVHDLVWATEYTAVTGLQAAFDIGLTGCALPRAICTPWQPPCAPPVARLMAWAVIDHTYHVFCVLHVVALIYSGTVRAAMHCLYHLAHLGCHSAPTRATAILSQCIMDNGQTSAMHCLFHLARHGCHSSLTRATAMFEPMRHGLCSGCGLPCQHFGDRRVAPCFDLVMQGFAISAPLSGCGPLERSRARTPRSRGTEAARTRLELRRRPRPWTA